MTQRLHGIAYAAIAGMESSQTNLQESYDTAEHHVVYRVFADEQAAAKAAQLLVEAGFTPHDVYVGVERQGGLERANTGRAVSLGIAMCVGAAISCSLGMLLVTSAAVGLISLPIGPLAGSAVAAAALSGIPCAIPGALLGWLVATLQWRRGAQSFPAQHGKPAFVGVEVGPGNSFTAELSLIHSQRAMIGQERDWPKLASGALEHAVAA